MKTLKEKKQQMHKQRQLNQEKQKQQLSIQGKEKDFAKKKWRKIIQVVVIWKI